MYHIYPRSFKDTSGNGIGDLAGIIEKLDYLNDGTENSLGVEALWLSPINRSPMVDFGYDVSDYYDIDPIFGDLETFDRLVSEAHRRNIKFVMDFVPNHTSSQHPWFLASRSSLNNPKRDWYIWRDSKPDGSPPNNWLSQFGGSAWTYDAKTKQYYLHTFHTEQPDLNWRNEEVRNEMFNVLRFWLKRGIDGFRTDAIFGIMKDDQFRDDPPNPTYDPAKDIPYNSLLHTYSTGSEARPELFSTVNSFCEVLGEHEDVFMVGEVFLDIPEMMQLYRACSNNLHAPFNFNLIGLPWNAEAYKKFIDDFEGSLTRQDWPNYVFGNHDQHRLATRIGRDHARTAALLLFTLRGMPVVYYGEELGMVDASLPPEKIQDPFDKQVPGYHFGRDPERAPMQWSKERYAAFSRVEPWLPVAEGYKTYNAEVESKDPRSMLNLYRTLIHFRRNSPALLRGTYRSLEHGNANIFAYIREYAEKRLLIVLNFSDEGQTISLDLSHVRAERDSGNGVGRVKVVCNTLLDRKVGKEVDVTHFTLRSNEGYLLEISDV